MGDVELGGLFVLCSLFKVLVTSYVGSRTPGTRTSVANVSFRRSMLTDTHFGLGPSCGSGLRTCPVLMGMGRNAPLGGLSPLFRLAPNTAVDPRDNDRRSFSSKGEMGCAMASRGGT